MSSEALVTQTYDLAIPCIPLADLISVQSGYAFASEDYTSSGHFLMRIGNVQDGEIRLDNPKYVTLDNRTRPFELTEGDILTSLTGNIGRVARIEKAHLPAALNQRVARLIVKDGGKLDGTYLYYALSTPDFREKLALDGGGAAQQNVSPKAIAGISIPLPPLDEQRRIAEVLRSVDEAIVAAESAVMQAEQALNLNAEKLLVHDLADHANECRLVDLIASLDAGVSVNSEGRPAADGEVGILKTSCVSAGHFDPNENKVVRHDEVGRTRVQPAANSIIISRMNTLDLVGANAFVAEDCPNLYLPDRLWLLKTNPGVICRWLAYYMKTARFRAQIIDIASGTSGSMKNISKGRLADLVLHVPEYAEQELAVGVLLAMESAMLSGRAILRSYRAMRQSLLSDLLSGHVRVPA